ncbi:MULTISPECIES: precorrin-6A reductase [unclassified Treponema]|uniref:precorrin-6A reductase n=1 Tax=unclassified Treponema TaxID=2638727 RepID=UPI0020A35FCC|nr:MULTISPECIES: precorrin-6A reductase [unclassified Treponema]UTC66516.1 precorrin-6A reductase [Treponema sp. OMZ 789]UTC69248.1 precorrin-6A reductase [Treponema sp. OMZ 790]UTC71961.1 precorrin-6A reductase [Treponema sp. OMZ 791]
MIWIIGGTTEAGSLADFLKAKNEPYIMSVATEEGRDFFKNHKLKIGRMDESQMEQFCIEEKISLIADLSHPYALIVSQNAKATAQNLNIKYLRFTRGASQSSADFDQGDFYTFDDMEGLCSFLKELKSSVVFFTTGSKTLADFEVYRSSNRFVYRILPTVDSVEKCKNAGVVTQDIIAMTGPFSQNLNEAMFKEYGASYVVMKDSGDAGGTKEKLAACAALGIRALILRRRKEEGIKGFEEFRNEVLRYGHA